MPERTKLYTLRLDDEEDARIKRIAAHVGVPISNLLRMLILKEERALGLDLKKKTKASR